jgi:hypothetical protein
MQQDPVRRNLEREPRDGSPAGRRSTPDPERRLPFADDDQATP